MDESIRITSTQRHPCSCAFVLKLSKFNFTVTHEPVMRSYTRTCISFGKRRKGHHPSHHPSIINEIYVYITLTNPVPISCNSLLGATLSKVSTPIDLYTRTWVRQNKQEPVNYSEKKKTGTITSLSHGTTGPYNFVISFTQVCIVRYNSTLQ